MSDSNTSSGTSVGDGLAMLAGIIIFTLFIIGVMLVTFFSSPGMAIMAVFRLVTGIALSARQTWVFAIFLSVCIFVSLVVVFRNLKIAQALYLLLCIAMIGNWALLTYGFEAKIGRTIADFYFPDEPAEVAKPAENVPAEYLPKPTPQPVARQAAVNYLPVNVAPSAPGDGPAAPHHDLSAISDPDPEPAPAPAPAVLRVTLHLPLKRAWVMLRLNDREVFRADYRSDDFSRPPYLVVPPVQVAPGPALLKVWVISPDKKAADEYLEVPLTLAPGSETPVAFRFNLASAISTRLSVDRCLATGLP